MDTINLLEPNTLIGFIGESIEFLKEPIGIISFLGAVIFIGIAIFTWPKKHIEGFGIGYLILFLCITIYSYHTKGEPSYQLKEYIIGVLEMIPYGIGYSLIYVIFYWISILTIFLFSREKPLSVKGKCVICIVNSIIFGIFMEFWEYWGLIIAILIKYPYIIK